MKHLKHITFAAIIGLLPLSEAAAQDCPQTGCNAVEEILQKAADKECRTGRIRIDSVRKSAKGLTIYASENFSYIPFRKEQVQELYHHVKEALLPYTKVKKIEIVTNNRTIESLIPSVQDKGAKTFAPKSKYPLVTCTTLPYHIDKGLSNKHIALWQSHGWYYENSLNRWEWQRARIFQTVEDLYPQSYVLEYLIPMLENAGANVLIPRERDWQKNEVIVDNDNGIDPLSSYMEYHVDKKWAAGDAKGFAHKRAVYSNFENPFKEGTYRQIESIRRGRPSSAEWIPNIPEEGKYAVYVSYHSLPKSCEDATYTVFHKGGKSVFKVNQTMGGGTWIYLGKFMFDKGKNPEGKVMLTNLSKDKGKIITADAVKFGGGYGNIARNGLSSQYPRFCEAARYWLQWAGVPDSIYSESHGENDYTDDYKCRGKWVNYLHGGRPESYTSEGLNIPIDMAFAFHTDAGTTLNDSIIGTLGIYCTKDNDEQFKNGASRYLSRELTDIVQSAIVHDIRTLYEPEWTRRAMWNKSYYEARVPEVPTMLLEFLSHQNFADMRYGLDPRFRFTVSRAIYKGILRYLSERCGQSYAVQPLPINTFSIRRGENNQVVLSWKPTADPLEPTAISERYIVYRRIGAGAFDNGTIVNGTEYITQIPEGKVCSFKVCALNKGGKSFPSEILSAGNAHNSKGEVLVINGFNRISAPADFVAPAPADTLLAGFYDDLDHGVPYIQDISYIGKMKEFRRNIPWMDDNAAGFGDSYGDYETMVIAGNSFDYPAIHGDAILQAGYSFVSTSRKAVEEGEVALTKYSIVDLILGKEHQTKMGRGGVYPIEFKTFTEALQHKLTDYCKNGGNLLVTGAYVGSDLWDNRLTEPLEKDKNFAQDILKYKWRVGQAAATGRVSGVDSPYGLPNRQYEFYHKLNSDCYVVESPDGIEPAGKDAHTVMRYSENGISAGVAYKGFYKTYILGFPFETIKGEKERRALMQDIIHFFTAKP